MVADIKSERWPASRRNGWPASVGIRSLWTNGQVERMNRTIKDATVKRYHYASHDELRQHLQLFVDAYNYGRRLKTVRDLTPYEFICQTWTKEPERFRRDPSHHIPGPNS